LETPLRNTAHGQNASGGGDAIDGRHPRCRELQLQPPAEVAFHGGEEEIEFAILEGALGQGVIV
jgi:hypothetical protein